MRKVKRKRECEGRRDRKSKGVSVREGWVEGEGREGI